MFPVTRPLKRCNRQERIDPVGPSHNNHGKVNTPNSLSMYHEDGEPKDPEWINDRESRIQAWMEKVGREDPILNNQITEVSEEEVLACVQSDWQLASELLRATGIVPHTFYNRLTKLRDKGLVECMKVRGHARRLVWRRVKQ